MILRMPDPMDLEIVVWAHRPSDMMDRCMKSINNYIPEGAISRKFIQPGNCHENMKRVWDTCNSRFLCYVDEDVEILDRRLFHRLVDIVSRPDIGAVVPLEAKEIDMAREYKEKWIYEDKKIIKKSGKVFEAIWLPAYCLMIDRDKVPDMAVDVEIPGRKGMTDVDICFQIHHAGFRTVMDLSTAVFHELKNSDHGWNRDKFKKYDCPVPNSREVIEGNIKQIEYMIRKWTEFFDNKDQFMAIINHREPNNDMAFEYHGTREELI